MKLIQTIVTAVSVATAWTVQAQSVQVPPIVQQGVNEINDRFLSVLEEECPNNKCFPVGCEVSNFLTLDETSTSSLPGLGEEPAKGPVQYKLTSVVCEFTHETGMEAEAVSSLKQRLRQKVKKVGVTVNIRSRELQPKLDEESVADNNKEAEANRKQELMMTLPWYLALWHTMLPFLPWLLSVMVGAFAFMIILWSVRRVGRVERRDPRARTRSSDHLVPGTSASTALALPDEAEPTPHMMMIRITQLREELLKDQKLIELTLRKHIDEENFDELCMVLRHFGPEMISPLKEKAEYRDTLTALSKAYSDKDFDEETPSDTWKFLSRLERSITAAKVRIESEPLEDEFSFMTAIEVDEFIGILREVTEQEALAAVAYAPPRLRERFFAQASAAFTSKFVAHLAKVERMPDHFVRNVAKKLRQLFMDKGAGYRTIRVDRIPLLEQALNSLDTAQRKALVTDMGKDDPTVLHSLAPVIFLDDSLQFVPDDVLTETFLSLPPNEAGNYLASFTWGPKLIKRLNPRVQDAIAPYVNSRAINQNLVQAARKKIATFIKAQDQKGTIDLRTINSNIISGKDS